MSKITSDDLEFMNQAIRLSARSAKMRNPSGGPFGAVVVKNGKIIGRGFNRVLGDNDPTAHGEIMAIRDACKNLGTHDLTGCILYTSCRPCPMCLAAIQWANIARIFYAAETKDASRYGFRDSVMYKSFKKPKAGTKIKLLAENAAKVMHQWHQKFWKRYIKMLRLFYE